jgi:hypothetical protein
MPLKVAEQTEELATAPSTRNVKPQLLRDPCAGVLIELSIAATPVANPTTVEGATGDAPVKARINESH